MGQVLTTSHHPATFRNHAPSVQKLHQDPSPCKAQTKTQTRRAPGPSHGLSQSTISKNRHVNPIPVPKKPTIKSVPGKSTRQPLKNIYSTPFHSQIARGPPPLLDLGVRRAHPLAQAEKVAIQGYISPSTPVGYRDTDATAQQDSSANARNNNSDLAQDRQHVLLLEDDPLYSAPQWLDIQILAGNSSHNQSSGKRPLPPNDISLPENYETTLNIPPSASQELVDFYSDYLVHELSDYVSAPPVIEHLRTFDFDNVTPVAQEQIPIKTSSSNGNKDNSIFNPDPGYGDILDYYRQQETPNSKQDNMKNTLVSSLPPRSITSTGKALPPIPRAALPNSSIIHRRELTINLKRSTVIDVKHWLVKELNVDDAKLVSLTVGGRTLCSRHDTHNSLQILQKYYANGFACIFPIKYLQALPKIRLHLYGLDKDRVDSKNPDTRIALLLYPEPDGTGRLSIEGLQAEMTRISTQPCKRGSRNKPVRASSRKRANVARGCIKNSKDLVQCKRSVKNNLESSQRNQSTSAREHLYDLKESISLHPHNLTPKQNPKEMGNTNEFFSERLPDFENTLMILRRKNIEDERNNTVVSQEEITKLTEAQRIIDSLLEKELMIIYKEQDGSQRSPLAAAKETTRRNSVLWALSQEIVNRQTLQARMPGRECIVCTETRSETLFAKQITARCRHVTQTCQDCLQLWISIELENKTWNRVKCPECKHHLRHHDMKKIASKEIFERYDKLATRAALSNIPDFRWCLRSGCASGQIHETGVDGPIFICAECSFKVCVVHTVEWHEAETCAQYDYRISGQKRRDEEAASVTWIKSNTKACPKCKWNIEKNDGCDHMTCRKCHYEFCWLCLADYNNIRVNGNTSHKKGCRYHK